MENNIYNKKGVDASAIVDPTAIIGKNNYIGPGVIIGLNVSIGDNNYIGPYCIIGMPPESRDWLEGFGGRVVIGSNNKLMKQVTVDGGTEHTTSISDNCMLLKNSHVGHDAMIFRNVILGCNVVIGGHCKIMPYSRVDLNSVVNPRVAVPSHVRIGSLSTVLKTSVMEYGKTYAGNPIRLIK